jgi:hypothetical protein
MLWRQAPLVSLLLLGASLPCAQAQWYNTQMTPYQYQEYINKQRLDAARPYGHSPPPVEDGSHRVDKAIAEFKRESRAWVAETLVEGSIRYISVRRDSEMFGNNRVGDGQHVEFHYNVAGNEIEKGVSIGTTADGSVGIVCYPNDDDPFKALIDDSEQHVIPSHAHLLPCYKPQDIGDAQIKRAALLRREYAAYMDKMANSMLEPLLHPVPNSQSSQQKSGCGPVATGVLLDKGALGGMILGGGCR